MNKTENKAHLWLLKEGYKGIVYQKRRVPTFLTDAGNFEVKRAYSTKTGADKILFKDGERDEIKEAKAKTLVFSEKKDEPLDILKPSEIDRDIVRNIVLHTVEWEKERIFITLERKLLERIDRELKRESTPFNSRSKFIEYHLMNVFFPRTNKDISVT